MPERLKKRIPLLLMTFLLTASISSVYLSFIHAAVSFFAYLLLCLLAVAAVELMTWNKWTAAGSGLLLLLHVISSLTRVPVFHDIAMSVNECAWDTYMKVFWTDRTLLLYETGTVCLVLFVVCFSIHIFYAKCRSVALSTVVLMVYIFFMDFYNVGTTAQVWLNLFFMLAALVVLYGHRWYHSGETVHKKRLSLRYGTPLLCGVLILSLLLSCLVNKNPNQNFRKWLDKQFSQEGTTVDWGELELPAFQQSLFEKKDGKLGGNVSFKNQHLFSVTTYGTGDATFFENSVYLRGVACDYFENDTWYTAIDDGQERLLSDYFYENLYFCSDGRAYFVQNALDESLDFYQERWMDISYDANSSDAIFNHTLTTAIAAFEENEFGMEAQDVYYDNSTYTYHKGNVNWYEVAYVALNRDSATLQTMIADKIAPTYGSSSMDETLKQQIQTYYLQMPENISDAVAALAERVTDDCINDYERAVAIESYLKTNYTYTLTPGTVPKDKNLVEYFLFESQKGYCVYYASSMVMLCRSIGIPARYVKGYRADGVGDYETVSVKDSDAHAWVEVLLPNLGWVTFDPVSSADFGQNSQQPTTSATAKPSATPKQTVPTPTVASDAMSPTPETELPETETPETATPRPTPSASAVTTPLKTNTAVWWILGIVGFLLVLAIAYFLWKRYAAVKRTKMETQKRQSAALRVYKRLICIYTFLEQPPEVGETVAQYLQRLENPVFTEMRDILDDCFYHQGSMTREQYRTFMTALQQVEERAIREKGKRKWKSFRRKFRRKKVKDTL